MRVLLVAAVAAVSFPANAQVHDFTGPRIEAYAGWDHIGVKGVFDDGVDREEVSGSEDGIVYGIEVGYDHQLPGDSATFGIYGAASLADTKRCEEVFGNDQACAKAKRDLEVGARLGGRWGDNGLVYVKLGYANGRARVSYRDNADATNNFSASDERGGVRLGAGGEWAFGPNTYAKVEYRWTDYGDYRIDEDTTAKVDRHQVVGGLGFRF